MKETLQIGDHILVNKFLYGIKIPFTSTTLIPIGEPKRGDIAVFEFPEDPDKDFIKRVVAIAGDKLELRDKHLSINGQASVESYAVFKDPQIIPGTFQPRDNLGPLVVPAGKVFVMGDNRDQSYDSRFWGFLDLKAVKGKAFMIYWSWDSENFGVRWRRIGDLIK